MRTRTRRLVVSLAGLGLLALLTFLLGRAPTERPAAHETRPQARPPMMVRSVPALRTDRQSGAENEETEPAPIVDEVSIEKTEVCEGEENLVTVKARTVNGTDGFLRYVVVGQGTGRAFPVRSYLDDKGEARTPNVRVFGRDNAMAEVKLPPFKVKECPPRPSIAITTSVVPNTEGRYRLYASIVTPPPGAGEPAPQPFAPVRFAWELGDGNTAVTETGRLEHEFAPGGADQRFWVYLVKVTAVGPAGQTITGRASLERANHAFDALHVKGLVHVFSSMEPRYAQISPGGKVWQRFRLWHVHPRAVRVEAVRLKWLGEEKEEVVDAERVLGTSVIPAGAKVEFELSFDSGQRPLVRGLNLDLRGRSEDGLPAAGMVSLMRPRPAPTRDKHIPVADPLLTAKILRARELLKQELVSDEELVDLERQGHFRDLIAAAPPPPLRPATPEEVAGMPK